MKFSQLAQGKAAEQPVPFDVIDAEGNVHTIKTLVRPLDGTQETAALVFAAQYAKDHGAPDAKEGHPLWDLGYMVKTVEIGCVDPDSPPKSREPTFDKGADAVLALPRQTIAFLFEAQQTWQDLVSPTQKRMAGHELLTKVRELAESEDDLPFLRLSPALRWICMRSMACLLLKSPEGSLLASSSSESDGASSSANGTNESKPSATDSASSPKSLTDPSA